jgi:uncharacterized SAM-binding protein YcdF (DUF218 family)
MYGVKQVVGALATPLAIALIVALAALLARRFGRGRLGTWLLACAVLIACLSATTPVSNMLLMPLETRYPPLDEQLAPPVTHIVVLGSYYSPRDNVPITAALGPDGLARIVEGVRLARVFPAARLVVSGGAPPGYSTSALGYAKLARELGIAPDKIIVVDTPRDTKEEAAAAVKLLGANSFVLVTSASHMPRAMRLMTAAGARPMAAPTGHRFDSSEPWSWRSLWPSAAALRNTEIALHEYVGLLALSIGLQ